MKKIWNKIAVFLIPEQRLVDHATQIQTNMWVTDMEIGEIRRKLERKSSKVEVQENDQKIIEHIENKQSQSEEQETQETFVKQGHENEQQQKI